VEHLEETRGQLEKLERCIEDRGGTPSTLKDAGAIFMANMQALAVLSWPMRSSRAVS
jgi:ferritin-like metal-binding protein YciE